MCSSLIVFENSSMRRVHDVHIKSRQNAFRSFTPLMISPFTAFFTVLILWLFCLCFEILRRSIFLSWIHCLHYQTIILNVRFKLNADKACLWVQLSRWKFTDVYCSQQQFDTTSSWLSAYIIWASRHMIRRNVLFILVMRYINQFGYL